ncbi:MAG: phospholipase D family protein [Cyclobacteriaceae bacterium]|nr:phospholipase D family protein [Cyclobacteriaceae bacterium]
MAKFLTGEDLENAICDVIRNAKQSLIIVSPYIKLDDYFKEIFQNKMKDYRLHFLLIFGKNENEYGKSLSFSDFEFFKNFPNVSIIYLKNLHGKYYGNEFGGILTSINMYDYSFKNNVEFGVYSEVSILDKIKSNFDNEIYNFCFELANSSPAVFIKRPIVEKKLLGISSNYHGSKILLDCTKDLVNNRSLEEKYLKDFVDIIDFNDYTHNDSKTRKEFEESKKMDIDLVSKIDQNNHFLNFGFCIRTGEKIPFNPEKPFTYNAYLSWANYENPDFEEKFCHYSGEPSHGETSMARPILRKNWRKAQKLMSEL